MRVRKKAETAGDFSQISFDAEEYVEYHIHSGDTLAKVAIKLSIPVRAVCAFVCLVRYWLLVLWSVSTLQMIVSSKHRDV